VYQEQVLSFKHLDVPLDEGKLVLNDSGREPPSLFHV